MKTAIITGVTGQDGSYLAELLLKKGYKVYGMIRRASTSNTSRIDHLTDNPNFIIRKGDVTDRSSIEHILLEAEPCEFYNLAAQSFVPESWTNPVYTSEVTGIGVLKCLEAVRYYQEHTGRKIKFYQAGSSEQFGKALEVPQNENTPFYPRSPYGVAKVFGYHMTRNYRESYNMYALTGILFNHESPRRGLEFVTRKITHTLARIANGEETILELGNLEARRDWGYAKDYVKAMWMMLQQEEPKDYVIATGETHSVREFVEKAAEYAGLGKIKWKGKGTNEKGYDENNKLIVKINKKYYRPAEVDLLLGDPSRAKKELGWKPKTSFDELVKIMVKADMELIKLKK